MLFEQLRAQSPVTLPKDQQMKIYLIAGAAFAALAAVPAAAQPPASPAPPAPPPGGPGGGMMRMPQNRAEVQQMIQERFNGADANHDGFVTREEMEAGMAVGRGPGGEGGMRGPRRGDRFERMDANHDGKLSLDELSGPMMARFDRADTNHDGTISPEERNAARAAMRARWQERNGGGDDQGPPPPPPPGDEPPQGE